MNIQTYTQSDDLPTLNQSSVSALEKAEWDRLNPDVHLVLCDGEHLRARCSIWLDSLTPVSGRVPAVIGHFEADSVFTGKEILDFACAWLAERGLESVVGPMNANTWNKYKLVTYSSGRAPFMMEPYNPPFYVEVWEAAGFSPQVHYHSSEVEPVSTEDPRLERTRNRLKLSGVRIRNLNLDDFEKELEQIYAVSSIAFAKNHYYTEIDRDAFFQLYIPFRNKIDPDLVFIAETDERAVGFVFGFPDFLQASYNDNIDTVVYKTIAVLPDRVYAGLGMLLKHLAHCRAIEKGYCRFINALITSQSKLSYAVDEGVTEFREYALFERNLRA